MMKQVLLLFTALLCSPIIFAQTLIMNEVSQGVTGNMEYIEFLVVDTTVAYDCNSGLPPAIDIRGWIVDDNSGYHGTGGVAAGALRFADNPLWSSLTLGTIILIYNDSDPDPTIPADDLSTADGNCVIVAPISDATLFESNPTTPGAIACSYPATGWVPGGNWSNILMRNGGDCARLVDLSGCEVFSVCWGDVNQNTEIYFTGNAGNTVFYFNDVDPSDQLNWSSGCTDDETILDANICGSNDQTPGAANNAANQAFINQFNNGCAPITPIAGSALVDNNEICGCDGQATASGSGSIGPYTYVWLDDLMTPIGQTSATATGLCDGTYNVEITSSIGCTDVVQIVINPGTSITLNSIVPVAATCNGGCNGTITVSVSGGTPPYSYQWYDDLGNPIGTDNSTISGLCAGNYSVEVSDGASSCPLSVDATVTEPAAINVVASNDGPICIGQPLNLLENGGDAVSWSWYSDGAATYSDNSISTPVASNVSDGEVFTVVVENAAGCLDSTTTIANVLPQDDASYSYNASSYCVNDSDPTPTISGLSGGTFTSAPAGLSIDSNTGAIDLSASTPNSYSITYTTNGSCSSDSTVNIIINSNGDASFTLLPNCTGATATITGDMGGIFTFTSNPGDGATINSTTGEISNGLSGSTYDVTYTTAAPCSGSSSQQVTLLIQDDASFTMTPTCDGGIATINGTVGGTFTFTTPPSDTAVINPNTGVISGGTEGSMYNVTYTTSGVCSSSSVQSVTAQICTPPVDIIIPTAFTPADISINGSWQIQGLDEKYPDNVVKIYNRWGNLLFEYQASSAAPYSNNQWDGTFNGKELPVASYYYIIETGTEDDNLTGTVTLIRN